LENCPDNIFLKKNDDAQKVTDCINFCFVLFKLCVLLYCFLNKSVPVVPLSQKSIFENLVFSREE